MELIAERNKITFKGDNGKCLDIEFFTKSALTKFAEFLLKVYDHTFQNERYKERLQLNKKLSPLEIKRLLLKNAFAETFITETKDKIKVCGNYAGNLYFYKNEDSCDEFVGVEIQKLWNIAEMIVFHYGLPIYMMSDW